MTKDIDSIIRKVQALLNRTVSRGASKDEMETALALAHRLMEKYSLSLEDCKVEDISIRESEDILIKTKNTHDFIYMASALAELFHCRILIKRKYLTAESKRISTFIIIVGETSNTRFVEFLLTEIFLNVTELCHLRSHLEGHTRSNMLIEKYSFERGYFHAVKSKCKALILERKEKEEETLKHSTGTSLLVVDTALENYLNNLNLTDIKLKSAPRKFSASSYNLGYQEGSKQSLDRRVSRQNLRLTVQ